MTESLHAHLARVIREESRQNYATDADRTDALAAAIIDALRLTEESEYFSSVIGHKSRLVGPWVEGS